MNEKLQELTEEEIAQVNGGVVRSDLLTMRMFGPIAHESDAPGRSDKPVFVPAVPKPELGTDK